MNQGRKNFDAVGACELRFEYFASPPTAEEIARTGMPSTDGARIAIHRRESRKELMEKPSRPGQGSAGHASRYIQAFGDISAIVLVDGDPDVVSVIASAGRPDGLGQLPVIVRNNTRGTIGEITVTATARHPAAATVNSSGDLWGLNPEWVPPGEIAFGDISLSHVWFTVARPEGWTFEFATSWEMYAGWHLSLPVSEVAVADGEVTGLVRNDTAKTITGVHAQAVGFDEHGDVTAGYRENADPHDLPPGGSATFRIDLRGECTRGLIAAKGLGPRYMDP